MKTDGVGRWFLVFLVAVAPVFLSGCSVYDFWGGGGAISHPPTGVVVTATPSPGTIRGEVIAGGDMDRFARVVITIPAVVVHGIVRVTDTVAVMAMATVVAVDTIIIEITMITMGTPVRHPVNIAAPVVQAVHPDGARSIITPARPRVKRVAQVARVAHPAEVQNILIPVRHPAKKAGRAAREVHPVGVQNILIPARHPVKKAGQAARPGRARSIVIRGWCHPLITGLILHPEILVSLVATRT